MKLTDIFKINQKQTKIKAKLNLTNIVKEEILGEDELDWDLDFDQTDPAARSAEKDMKSFKKKRKGDDADEGVLLGGDVEEAAPKGLEKRQEKPNRLKPDMFWKRNEDDSTSIMHSKEHGEHEHALIDRLWQLGAGRVPKKRETITAIRDEKGNYTGDKVRQNYPHIDTVLSQDQIEAIMTSPTGPQGTEHDKIRISKDAHDAADAFGYDIIQDRKWMVKGKGKKKIPIYKNTLHQGSHYNDAKQDWTDRGGYHEEEKSDYDKKQAASQEKYWKERWTREEREEAIRKGDIKIKDAPAEAKIDMKNPQLTKDQILNMNIGQLYDLKKQFTFGIYDALSNKYSDDEKDAIEDEFDAIIAAKAATKAKAKSTRKKTQRMVDRGEKEATMTARQKMEDDEKFKKGIKDLKKRHNKKPGDGDANEAEELDPRQKKRKQGKDFKGYTAVWPADPKKPKDRRDPNIKRASVSQHYPDYDKKKKEYVVPPKQRKGDDVGEEFIGDKAARAGMKGRNWVDKKRGLEPTFSDDDVANAQYDPNRYGKDTDWSARIANKIKGTKGDDVDEISMQQARKSYGVGQGKTMAGKQRQTKGLGGIGSSQRNFATRHKAIGAKTGQVRKAVGGTKVIAQTQKRKRQAKMSDMVKGLGNVGRKAIYGGDDSVREQKVTKLNKKQFLEVIKETIKEIIND